MSDQNRDEHPREFIRRHLQEMVKEMKKKYGQDASFEEIELPSSFGGVSLPSLLGAAEGPEVQEKVSEIENEFKQRATILMAGSDLPTAIKEQIAKIHDQTHQLLDDYGVLAYLAAQLEADPQADNPEQSADEVKAFRHCVGLRGLEVVKTAHGMCLMHNTAQRIGIPGRHRDSSSEPDDFDEFMQKLQGQKPAEA